MLTESSAYETSYTGRKRLLNYGTYECHFAQIREFLQDLPACNELSFILPFPLLSLTQSVIRCAFGNRPLVKILLPEDTAPRKHLGT